MSMKQKWFFFSIVTTQWNVFSMMHETCRPPMIKSFHCEHSKRENLSNKTVKRATCWNHKHVWGNLYNITEKIIIINSNCWIFYNKKTCSLRTLSVMTLLNLIHWRKQVLPIKKRTVPCTEKTYQGSVYSLSDLRELFIKHPPKSYLTAVQCCA